MSCYRAGRLQKWLVTFLVLNVAATAYSADETITFLKNKTELYEGDACTLPGPPVRSGVCRKAELCPQGLGNNAVHCEFSVNDPVVCCPVAAGGKTPSNVGGAIGGSRNTNRITAGFAKMECEGLQSRSSELGDHLSGNREQVALGEFPFMAFVYFGDGEGSEVECGASLITKRFLLTAAHCFRSYQPVSVRLGAILKNDTDPELVYRVKKVHSHEGNKRRREDDIALIELEKDVEYDSHINPICLNNRLLDIDPSLNLTVMGWGTDGDGTKTHILAKGTVNAIPLDQCRAAYRNVHVSITLGEGHLCALGERSLATGQYTDTCPGDSGGPMIAKIQQKYYLVGVVSFGASCSLAIPGIYTRVSHYLDWIEQTVWGQQ